MLKILILIGWNGSAASFLLVVFCCYDSLHDFSLTIPRCHKDTYVNKFFVDKVSSFLLQLASR